MSDAQRFLPSLFVEPSSNPGHIGGGATFQVDLACGKRGRGVGHINCGQSGNKQGGEKMERFHDWKGCMFKVVKLLEGCRAGVSRHKNLGR